MAYKSKRPIAYELYKAGLTQQEIADMLGVSKNTINSWAKNDNWKQKRQEYDLATTTVRENAFQILNNMLKTMRQDQEDAIAAGKPPRLDKGDIDAAQKMHTMVRQPLATYEVEVRIIRELMAHLHDTNLELAKQMLEPSNNFLLAKRKSHGL